MRHDDPAGSSARGRIVYRYEDLTFLEASPLDVVKGTRVYVPLTIARAVMASVMKTHAFDGITYTFVPGAEVVSRLAPNEARRLFGAASGHHHHGGGQP